MIHKQSPLNERQVMAGGTAKCRLMAISPDGLLLLGSIPLQLPVLLLERPGSAAARLMHEGT